MHIACITGDGSFPADQLLSEVAARCMAMGLQICGVVQQDRDAAPGRKCHMEIVVLPDGPKLRISQDRGELARGCRLDADALERAVAQTAQRLVPETDLLIVNKFGKHEAMGRGFRPVIAQAVDLQIPVVLAVSPLNREALDHFAEGAVQFLSHDSQAVIDWVAQTTTGLGRTAMVSRGNWAARSRR